VRAVYVASVRQDARSRDLLARAQTAGCEVHSVDEARLTKMADTTQHQGVVAIVDAKSAHVTLDDVLGLLEEPPLLLVLDGVTDPHNLGACPALC
jgi:23S rRNA (guanosine2251-2'-O)-methyltransferase